MKIFEITPLKKSSTKSIDIPGSKSYTNRALIMAALTKESVTLRHPLYSEDTEIMIDCLKALGIKLARTSDSLVVCGSISNIEDKHYELFVKDSGTTFRFLLALLCLTPGTKILRGNSRLNERPIGDLVDALRSLGANISYLEKEGQGPLKILPAQLNSNSRVSINVSMSSQFVSTLLMISPLLNGLKIHSLGKLISKPYIEMTLNTMREWGIHILSTDSGYVTPAGQAYQKAQYSIEGDFSSAGYFFGIAALTQSTLTLNNLNPHSLQADRYFLKILEAMGNEVIYHSQGITLIGKSILPQSLNMIDCPDQVPTMAVLSSFAKGITRISGVRSLRFKETERVAALKNELAKMNIKVEDTEDTLTIYGGNPKAAVIDTYGDHRIAMAFAMAGTKLPGVKIRNPEVVNKTFPNFWQKLSSL